MRINRPTGTLLLLWPTLAALWAASGGIPHQDLLLIFVIGTFLMRSAGCVLNDIADRNLDPLVERTAKRPLAAGRISVRSAMLVLAVLLGAAAALLLELNTITRWLAFPGLALAVIYPFFKRFSYLPQVPLGAAFSWGLVMAFSAVQGTVPMETWLLFTGSLLWIIAYDTYYGMIDRDDDAKAGIRSTAILFGAADRAMILALQLFALGAFLLFGQEMEYRSYYYVGLLLMGISFVQQYRSTRKRSRMACFQAFKNNVWSGFALFVGTAAELGLPPPF